SFEFIKRTLETDKNQETMSYFIIEQEGNQLLGVVSLRDITTYRATIGYWLDEDHTKRGYMTQAAGLLLAKAKEKGIEEVILKCSPTNIGSQRVAEKLGFEYEYTQSKAENLYGVLGNLKVYIKYL
ncbi:MAG: GNAT family N-acetyltransferase, partial [Neisseriaceae bacterium]|nr:GNAT family N-acetyltransferase [Neisseriaceae bacterium]